MTESKIEDEDATNINDSFITWSKKYVTRLGGFIFTLASGASVGYNIFIAFSSYNIEQQFALLYATQLVMIILILIIIAFANPPEDDSGRYPRGAKVLQQFWNLWSPLWGTWLILYIAFTIKALSDAGIYVIGNKEVLTYIIHQLNNLTTLIFLMIYHVMDEPSLSETGDIEGDIFSEQQRSVPVSNVLTNNVAKFVFWIMLFVVIGVIELWLMGIIQNNGDSPYQSKDILQIFGIISGVAAAVGVALVISRLDSNLLGVPTWAVTFFLLYVGIQPALDFVLNMAGNRILKSAQEIIMIVALMSKILFFAVIQWLVMTDRMLYFFVQSYALKKGVRENREKFLNRRKEKKDQRKLLKSG